MTLVKHPFYNHFRHQQFQFHFGTIQFYQKESATSFSDPSCIVLFYDNHKVTFYCILQNQSTIWTSPLTENHFSCNQDDNPIKTTNQTLLQFQKAISNDKLSITILSPIKSKIKIVSEDIIELECLKTSSFDILFKLLVYISTFPQLSQLLSNFPKGSQLVSSSSLSSSFIINSKYNMKVSQNKELESSKDKEIQLLRTLVSNLEGQLEAFKQPLPILLSPQEVSTHKNISARQKRPMPDQNMNQADPLNPSFTAVRKRVYEYQPAEFESSDNDSEVDDI